MLIAVISDTHMNQPSGWFLSLYDQHLAGADVLVHCGDVTGPAVWHHLMQHPNLICAKGNCDWDSALANELDEFAYGRFESPQFDLPEGHDFSLAACHGWGSRSGVPVRVAQHFGMDWDLICFGHTHARYFSDEHGPLMLNPGSLGESGSWALVTVGADSTLSCEFHTVQL